MSGGKYHQQNKGTVQGQNVGDRNFITQHFHYYASRRFIALMVLVVLVCVLVIALILSPTGAFKLFGSTTPTTTSSSSATPHTQITPTPLVCSSGCDYRLQAVLDSIGVGPSSYLTLNFSVTNTSPGSCEMSFSTLTLRDENNNSQYTQPEGPGTGDYGVILPPNNPVQVSPYFPQAPLQGLLDLQVALRVACPPGSHQVYLIWYQMETVKYNV